jgi:hypothetical protein
MLSHVILLSMLLACKGAQTPKFETGLLIERPTDSDLQLSSVMAATRTLAHCIPKLGVFMSSLNHASIHLYNVVCALQRGQVVQNQCWQKIVDNMKDFTEIQNQIHSRPDKVFFDLRALLDTTLKYYGMDYKSLLPKQLVEVQCLFCGQIELQEFTGSLPSVVPSNADSTFQILQDFGTDQFCACTSTKCKGRANNDQPGTSSMMPKAVYLDSPEQIFFAVGKSHKQPFIVTKIIPRRNSSYSLWAIVVEKCQAGALDSFGTIIFNDDSEADLFINSSRTPFFIDSYRFDFEMQRTLRPLLFIYKRQKNKPKKVSETGTQQDTPRLTIVPDAVKFLELKPFLFLLAHVFTEVCESSVLWTILMDIQNMRESRSVDIEQLLQQMSTQSFFRQPISSPLPIVTKLLSLLSHNELKRAGLFMAMDAKYRCQKCNTIKISAEIVHDLPVLKIAPHLTNVTPKEDPIGLPDAIRYQTSVTVGPLWCEECGNWTFHSMEHRVRNWPDNLLFIDVHYDMPKTGHRRVIVPKDLELGNEKIGKLVAFMDMDKKGRVTTWRLLDDGKWQRVTMSGSYIYNPGLVLNGSYLDVFPTLLIYKR